MYLQSLKSVKHNAANSINRSSLKKSRHMYRVRCLYSSFIHAEKEEIKIKKINPFKKQTIYEKEILNTHLATIGLHSPDMKTHAK